MKLPQAGPWVQLPDPSTTLVHTRGHGYRTSRPACGKRRREPTGSYPLWTGQWNKKQLGSPMRIRELLECCLYVDDLDQAARFYADVLGLELVDRQAGRHVFFRCGQRMLLIFDPRGSDDPDSELPRHGAQGVGHVAFAAANDELPAWQTHLEQHGVRIVHTIDWPQGGRSIYFDDPAGNSLEIASPRIWQIDERRCFEGEKRGKG